MSSDQMQEILGRLAKDADFREKFTSNAQDVLKNYTLSDDHKTVLTQMAKVFASDKILTVPTAPTVPTGPTAPTVSVPTGPTAPTVPTGPTVPTTSKTSIWPTTFKETAAFIVSVVLMVFLGYVIWQTYLMMPNAPQVLKVGNTTQVVDSFGRAKDTLNILFPLFAAVVTFWLGVAVESKRGDQMANAADRATGSETATKVQGTSSVARLIGGLEQKRKDTRIAMKMREGQSDPFEELIAELYKVERDIANA